MKHQMPLEVICFDCVDKFCYKCVYDEHKKHHSTPKDELVKQIQQNKLNFEEILS